MRQQAVAQDKPERQRLFADAQLVRGAAAGHLFRCALRDRGTLQQGDERDAGSAETAGAVECRDTGSDALVLAFLSRRVAFAAALIFVIASAAFLLTHAVPGDYFTEFAPGGTRRAGAERAAAGFDRPLFDNTRHG